MTKHLLATSLAFLLVACTAPVNNGTNDQASQTSQGDDHSVHGGDSSSVQTALDRLNNSPRHHEWVEVKNGDKTIYAFVVHPQSSAPAPVVLLIHENRGLNDWARAMADQVAEAGYIAVAPDLLSGYSAEAKRTSDFPNEDAARTALGELKPEAVMSDLQAVVDYAKAIPSSNGKLASAGFCWGGGKSFELATKAGEDLAVAMVFYGTGPTEPTAYQSIETPIYGFYGGNDERVNATIDASKQHMTAAGEQFEPVIYDGAGHAFMRLGEEPNAEPANVAARDAAWERMKTILEGLK